MRLKRAKFFLIIVLLLFTFFFSNDFGLIDVEKTSIVTAIAVDYKNDEYLVTTQAAVPEATDTNTENQKAQLSGKGKTVGEALKDLADLSGWFPKLAFCNLIILGNELANDNALNVLDFFAKTLRIQDSALVVLAEKDAKDLLSLSTPLDNISSFAMQKIIYKTSGFDRDVCPTNIKTFCAGHYSYSSSAYMPIVKVVSADNGSGSGGQKQDNSSGSSSSSDGNMQKSSGSNADSNNLFDARTTALFKNGKKVGELDEKLTLTFNAFNYPLSGTNISVPEVDINGKKVNFLLTIIDGNNSFKVKTENDSVLLTFNLNLFCKVSDTNTDYIDDSVSQNKPIPKAVVDKATESFVSNIEELVQTSVQTGCDFLQIKEKLYRYNHNKYSLFKDNYLTKLKTEINVNISGQK